MSTVRASTAMLPLNSYSWFVAAHRRFLCFSMSRAMGHVVLLGPVHSDWA